MTLPNPRCPKCSDCRVYCGHPGCKQFGWCLRKSEQCDMSLKDLRKGGVKKPYRQHPIEDERVQKLVESKWCPSREQSTRLQIAREIVQKEIKKKTEEARLNAKPFGGHYPVWARNIVQKQEDALKGRALTGPLQDYANPCNQHDWWGRTPLMEAVYYGDVQLILRLLEACPSVDCTWSCEKNLTVVDYWDMGAPWSDKALSNPGYDSLSDVLKVAQLLMTHCQVSCTKILWALVDGLNFDWILSRRNENYRLSHQEKIKGALPIVRAALACPDVDVNARNDRGLTPLMEVTNPEIVRLLLQTGKVDVNAKGGHHNKNALLYALEFKREWRYRPADASNNLNDVVGVVKLLAPLTSLTETDEEGKTTLALAQERQAAFAEAVRILRQKAKASNDDWVKNKVAERLRTTTHGLWYEELVQVLKDERKKEIQKGLGLANVPGMPGGLRADISSLLAPVEYDTAFPTNNSVNQEIGRLFRRDVLDDFE